jgi:serine/threonine protein kinase
MKTPSEGITRQISDEIERHLIHFERTWGQQDAPSIEQLLDKVPESDRENLLRELLFIEFEFIRRNAAELLTEQYLARFPEYEYIIHEIAQAVRQYAVFKHRSIAGYSLLDELGRGGMGVVYKAKSDLLNNVVAFKMVSQRTLDNPEALKRFIRELEMIGRLKHPNIVEAKHAGVTDDGTPYLIMEFVEGITLAQWGKQNPPSGTGSVLESGTMRPSNISAIDSSEQKSTKTKGRSEVSRIVKACDIIRTAASGLQAIHEAGLVHRDIKPGNIMLLPDGQVKILDLGLAKLREHIAEHPSEYSRTQYYSQTQQGQFLGTPGYAAPEQTHSATDVDIRADIYSLGCTFFYLLYGRTPSERQADEVPMAFPKKIRSILDKMLAADPAARFQEPREVVDALDLFLGRKKKHHWGKALAVTALFSAVFFGVLFGMLLPKPSNHANLSLAPPYTKTATNEQSDKVQQMAANLQEAVGFRYRGNSEEAEERLRTLETDLREHPFVGSDTILAEVLSGLGDCLFFEGFASNLLTEKKVQRMIDWYNEAWELAGNASDDFRLKLLCKLAVVNDTADTIPLVESKLSLYHHFAEEVITDSKQSQREFVKKRFELGEALTSREALELRLFVCERIISWAMEKDSENLPEDLQELDNIIPRDLDSDLKGYFTNYMNRLYLSALARNRSILRLLGEHLPHWQEQEATQGTMQ